MNIILYNFGITLTKISIAFQYLRLTMEKQIRLVCWFLICLNVAVSFEALIAGILQCNPVAKAWDPRIPGKCIDTGTLNYVNAALSIVQDIALVVLPFFMLRQLIMPRKEKIILMVVLGLGGV